MERKRPIDDATPEGGNEEDSGLTVLVTCYKCNAEIGTFKRKKHRRRMCKQCLESNRQEREQEDPLRRIEGRLRSSFSSKKIKVPRDVVLSKLVKRVCDRWERKSVLSGETDMSKLCITGYKRLEEGVMPDENNLILVTSAESIALARYKTEEGRLSKFSLEVKGKILLNKN